MSSITGGPTPPQTNEGKSDALDNKVWSFHLLTRREREATLEAVYGSQKGLRFMDKHPAALRILHCVTTVAEDDFAKAVSEGFTTERQAYREKQIANGRAPLPPTIWEEEAERQKYEQEHPDGIDWTRD